mgnify:CR=1 FL=1
MNTEGYKARRLTIALPRTLKEKTAKRQKLYKEIELLESEKKAGFKNVDETIPEYDWDKWLN